MLDFLDSGTFQSVAAAISVIVAIFSIAYGISTRFTDRFNLIYKETFGLRSKCSSTAQKHGYTDFYYEIDIINSDNEIRESILDYLTEMENFFNLVPFWNFYSRHSLSKLTSLAFYQRIATLYSFILFKQAGTKLMFKDYHRVTRMMRNMKKIKSQLNDYHKMCYIGIRESDLSYAGNFFSRNICLFPKDNAGNRFPKRFNQNITQKEMLPYFQHEAEELSNKYSFMFYNPNTAYSYSDKVIENTVCLNSQELLSLLNNKLHMKKWLADKNLPIIPYETFIGSDVLLSKCTEHFPGSNRFVIQTMHGGGGVGTYYADKDNFAIVSNKLKAMQKYLVSPFKESISVNVHVFIAEKQTVMSPGSVQIIEKQNQQLCYCGCDFISFRLLPSDIHDRIKRLCLKTANLLRDEGYRGVAGIDFIITAAGEVFCAEINPRFQASSVLLDRYLNEKKRNPMEAASCYELNLMAFQGAMITTLNYENVIPYSMYFYYADAHLPLEYYCKKIRSYQESDEICLCMDDVFWYMENEKIGQSSYLFRAIFPYSITGISPDWELWISDNVRILAAPANMLELKVGLLNQGVHLKDSIPDIKKGVYGSIDIMIKGGSLFDYKEDLYINCAYGIHHSQYSPYQIFKEGTHYFLSYYGNKLTEVNIETNRLQNLDPISRKILYLSTDRLRIKLVAGCENKNYGKGCLFCDLPVSEMDFSLEQIFHSLEIIKQEEIDFRHILIGGGSSLSDGTWDKIITICRHLKEDAYFKDKPISIMTMLPPVGQLSLLKQAGVDEVAFNIEVSDESLGLHLMPGKYADGKEKFYFTLKAAVQQFGIGYVRSALIVGLDKKDTLYSEIYTLTDMGIMPCLSALRILPGTSFCGKVGPTNEYLVQIYQEVIEALINRTSKIKYLGPSCPCCRNNMLAL